MVGILNGCEYPEQSPEQVTLSLLYERIEHTLFNWMVKHEQLETSYYVAHQRMLQFKNTPIEGPLVTSVGRLTEQKVLLLCQQYGNALALDKVCEIINRYNGRLIILGSGNKALESIFTKAMARNANLLFLKGYGQGIGDSLYELGDLFLMPSSFEPCGISQMLAMRAGQPCLVHSVGGLKDTVSHKNNGFAFFGGSLDEQVDGLMTCLTETLTLKQQNPKQWEKITANAKGARFSWETVAADYISSMYC